MQNIKIVKRHVKPTKDQLEVYYKNNHRQRPAKNLRFGKIIIMADQDLDG